MKKRTIQCVVGLLSIILFNGNIVLAESALESSTTQLVTKLHRYFPKVEGTVVSVQEDNVFIDLGIEHDIVTGAQLAILQEGIEVVHPTTGKVLGTYQKLLGTLQVTEVREQFSVTRILWTEPEITITPGMMVGGIPGRVKVSMLPVKPSENPAIDTQILERNFVQALRDDDRFTVFDEADLQAAALKAGVASQDFVQEQTLLAINNILQAHNFVQLDVQPVADSDTALMQIVLLSPQGEEIGSVQEIFDSSLEPLALAEPPAQPEPAAVAEISPDSSAAVEEISPSIRVQEQFWKSDILRMKIHKLAVGDLTGDGKNEVVITSQTDIEIYQHGVLGEKDSFLMLNKIEGYNDALILSVDVGDINQNGRAEIFLTTLRSVSTTVQVFEYADGQFREIWSKKGLVLRVLHRPAQTPVLVGQGSTASLSFDLLTGKLYVYTWNGTGYARQDTLDVPGRVDRIFGVALVDVDQNGVDEVLFYDKNDRVQLLRNGKPLWRSRSYEPYNMNAIRKKEDEDTIRKAPGRVALTRIAADNDMRLVLINNLRAFKILKGLPMYNGSKFLILRWNGEKFVEEFASEEFDGYLTDYAAADVDNDGQQEIVMAEVLRGDNYFKTPQSQIVVYELEHSPAK